MTLAVRKPTLVYCRQSHSRADQDESISLAFQEHRIREYCERNGMDVLGVYTDLDVSGNVESRSGLDALLARCKQGGIQTVAIYNISRLARDTYLFLKITRELSAQRIELASASESMEDKTITVVLSAFAERERTTLSNNIAAAVRESARRGIMTQPPPYGYSRIDGEVVINPSEAATVRRIFAETLRGQTTGAIMDGLHRDHIPTAHGLDTWQRSTVLKVLKNPAYVGMIRINETRDPAGRTRPALTTKGNHEPIIDDVTWTLVQRMITQPTRKKTKHETPWLAGVAICASCGRRMYLEVDQRKTKQRGGAPYWVLRCSLSRRSVNIGRENMCDNPPTVGLHLIDPVARQTLAHCLSQLSTPEEAHARAKREVGTATYSRGQELRDLLADKEDRLERIEAAYESGSMALFRYSKRKSELEQEIEAARIELAAVPVIPTVADFSAIRAAVADQAFDPMAFSADDLRRLAASYEAVARIDSATRSVDWSFAPPFSWLVQTGLP